jgi:hypothetical protein
MVKKSQDEIIRAYAMLQSLRKNVDQMPNYSVIEETFVHEFHSTLDRLANIGIDVSEFRIPDTLMKSKVTSGHIGADRVGHFAYSKEKYVKKSIIMTKLDAILSYFEIITSDKPKRIGFNTHKD